MAKLLVLLCFFTKILLVCRWKLGHFGYKIVLLAWRPTGCGQRHRQRWVLGRLLSQPRHRRGSRRTPGYLYCHHFSPVDCSGARITGGGGEGSAAWLRGRGQTKRETGPGAVAAGELWRSLRSPKRQRREASSQGGYWLAGASKLD